jgi:hypothetical protein
VPAARLKVVKTAIPTQVDEPGAVVKFSVDVTNESPFATVEITNLTDDIYGSITQVHGSITSTTCSVPQTDIEPGATYSCNFMAQVNGDGDTAHTDTVTAKGIDVNNNLLEGSDDATVSIIDQPPDILVEKTVSPTEVLEPGAYVAFSIKVSNTSLSSGDALTLTSLTDSIYGNLNGQGSCSVPQTIAAGGSYSCSFTVFVGGLGDTSETDVATASGKDDDGNDVEDMDDATVDIKDVAPAASLTKTATSAVVTYAVTVKNDSTAEALDLTALNDDKFGDITQVQGAIQSTSCAVPQTIAKGGSYYCSFDATVGTSPHTNTVSGTVSDDEGNTVNPAPADSATVTLQ